MARISMERSGEMEVFARVVQEGGFSAAARTLGLTPSAVSKLIGRLEARLGARLMTRTTRSLTLTPEGEAYHRAALAIVQAPDEAEVAVASGAVRGQLTVSSSVPIGSLCVVPLVAEFVELHPDLAVDLSLTDDVVDLVSKRTEVAIRMGDLPDSSLMARKLGHSARVVCAAPEYLRRRGSPEVPADLAKHECMVFNFNASWSIWPFVVDGHAYAQGVSGNLKLNNGETMRQLALAGMGIIRVGRFLVAEELAAGTLVPLLEAHNPGDIELIHAVYVGGGRVPRRVRAFIDFLVERMKSSPLVNGS